MIRNISYSQRYGSKEDVIVPERYSSCISHKELFLSTLEDYRTINCIKRPIKVLTYHEYENLQWEEEYLYFSRYRILLYDITVDLVTTI